MCGMTNHEPYPAYELPVFDEPTEFGTATVEVEQPITPNWSGVDLADQLRDAADRAEELTRERDEALDEVNRLEAELRAVEEDKLDLDDIASNLSAAEREISNLRSEIEAFEGRVADLRYTDLEDVVDEIENLANHSDLDSYLDDVENSIYAAKQELERF